MRFLSIDLGDKRTGLAVGDDVLRIATPVDVLAIADPARLIEALAKMVEEHEPDELVVGLPLNMDGSEGPRAALVRRLAAKLGKRTGRRVHLFDERLTSFAAEEGFKGQELTRGQKKQRRDALAAAVILNDFLQARGGKT